MRITFYLFICIFFLLPNEVFSQKNIDFGTIKKATQVTVNEYYAIVNQVTNISCPRGKSNRISNIDDYIEQITSDYFFDGAEIYISFLNLNNEVKTTKRGYKRYFSRLSQMCGGSNLFKNVEYSIESIKINKGDITCHEIDCEVTAIVNQRFNGIRNNGTIYCDITTRKFILIVNKQNNNYAAKISKVTVDFTRFCE